MASYDPKQINIAWAGIPFQGVMDGQFVDVDFQEDNTMLHVGAQGFTTFVENANESAIATVTLSQRSPTNQLLSAAFRTKKMGLFLIKDLSDKLTIGTGFDTRIGKHAPIRRGKEIIGLEWKLLISRWVPVAGGDT